MKYQFNIKAFMLIVLLWALPNALFAWVMRAHPTAIPRGQGWRHFIGINIMVLVFTLFGLHMKMMLRYMGRGRTAAQIRAHNREILVENRPLNHVINALVILSFFAWKFERSFWGLGLHSGHLALLLVVAPVITMVCIEIRKRPTRRDWTPASLGLLLNRMLGVAWTIGTGFFFLVYKPHLGAWGFGPAFPIPPSILLMMFGVLVLASISAVLGRIVEREDQEKKQYGVYHGKGVNGASHRRHG